MNARYTIAQACSDVAEALASNPDHSETTIRCALNDALDSASKGGQLVRFDYNQPLAVRRVRALWRADARRKGAL